MIGIKIKNSFWEKALLSLLKERAEIWVPETHYQVVISDAPSERKLSISYSTDQKEDSLSLPFKIEELERLLIQQPPMYENKFFIWESALHQLKDKQTNEVFYLTEKESKIIDFLSCCPQKTATKEQLLENVWNYTTETETHTVESSIHRLRQKIGKHADKFITPVEKGYRLI